jgi:hypothetical protein
LYRVVSRSDGGNLMAHGFLKRLREEAVGSASEERLLNGEDLIQLGFSPGPQFAEIMRIVDDLHLERKLRAKEEALEYVVKHFVR